MHNNAIKNAVWKCADILTGKDPSEYRQDPYGNQICFSQYGTNCEGGWDINHIKPQSRGGSNNIGNLQALKINGLKINGLKINGKLQSLKINSDVKLMINNDFKNTLHNLIIKKIKKIKKDVLNDKIQIKNDLLNDKIKKIKNETKNIDDLWLKKINEIKMFVMENKCFPYSFTTLLNCTYNSDGIPNSTSKNKNRSNFRNKHMIELCCCNFTNNNNEPCLKYITNKYAIKKDPFKCYYHANMCVNCVNWIDPQHANKKYDNYCCRCFKNIFPEDPRSKVIYTHTKEMKVRNILNEHFTGFIHDKPLYTDKCDCTHRRRIDHRKLIGATLLCIETDEYAHIGYDKTDEEIRYDDLFMIHSGKWVFIRFNPDGKGVKLIDKLVVLVKEVNKQIKRIEHEQNTELIEIIKLFYG